MDKLPVEVIEHILELALPSAPLTVETVTSSAVSHHPLACWAIWEERSSLLRSISQVNRHLSRWAQRELWRHVVCTQSYWVDRLLEGTALLDERDPGRRGITETVRLGLYDYGEEWSPEPPPTVDGSSLGRLLHVLQPPDVKPGDGIKELWLCGMYNVDLREIWPFEDLRLLYCVQTHLWTNQDAAPMPSASSIRLPRLRTLVTAELEVDDEMDTSFPNHDFASLEGLALRSSLPRSLRIGTSTGRAAGQATTGN